MLEGQTRIVDRANDDRVIRTSPGEFDGELGILTGQRAFVACVVAEPGTLTEATQLHGDEKSREHHHNEPCDRRVERRRRPWPVRHDRRRPVHGVAEGSRSRSTTRDLCARARGPTFRSQPAGAGIFAVGDVRSGSVKRVASAVGEGSVVIQAVHHYLASLPEPSPNVNGTTTAPKPPC